MQEMINAETNPEQLKLKLDAFNLCLEIFSRQMEGHNKNIKEIVKAI